MKTVLVTGADGFIGRRMTVAAQAAGWKVIGLDRAAKPCEDGRQRTDDGGQRADHLSPLPTAKAGEAGRGPVGPRPDWIVADITADAPIELPAGIDAIIHLAGKAHALAEVAQDVDEYFRINTEGTRRMLEAAQRAGVRAFVLFSTVKAAGDRPSEVAGSEERVASRMSPKTETRNRIGECGNQGIRNEGRSLLAGEVESSEQTADRCSGEQRHNRAAKCAKPESRNQTGSGISVNQCELVVPIPLNETCPYPPDTPYGQSKRAAEKLVLEGGYVPHPVAIRPCLVYGPTPKGNLEKMIEAVKRGRFPPLPEVGNKRSMVHIDDVIAAALMAAEHPAAKGQIFIAGDNEPFSTRQLYEWICQAAGKKVPRWSVPLWVLRLLGRIGDLIGKLRGRRFVFDSDALAKLTGSAWYTSAKLQRELGWKPRHTLRGTMPTILGAAPRICDK